MKANREDARNTRNSSRSRGPPRERAPDSWLAALATFWDISGTNVHRINTIQVLVNLEIGRKIVEHEQNGAKRAEYGKRILEELSNRLKEEFGRGYSLSNLNLMRKFYLV